MRSCDSGSDGESLVDDRSFFRFFFPGFYFFTPFFRRLQNIFPTAYGTERDAYPLEKLVWHMRGLR